MPKPAARRPRTFLKKHGAFLGLTTNQTRSKLNKKGERLKKKKKQQIFYFQLPTNSLPVILSSCVSYGWNRGVISPRIAKALSEMYTLNEKPPELFGVMETSVSCCTSGHMTVLVKVHSAPYLNKNNLLHKLHLSKPILFLLCHLLKGNSYLLECGMGKLEHKNLKNLFPVQLGMWFLRKGILRAGITMLKMRISIPN